MAERNRQDRLRDAQQAHPKVAKDLEAYRERRSAYDADRARQATTGRYSLKRAVNREYRV
jgi:hypothetical protein